MSEPIETIEEIEQEKVNKIDQLGDRVKQYEAAVLEEVNYFVEQHNYYLGLIDQTGYNNPDADPVLLGPGILSNIEKWYSFARRESYAISAKCRDLQKFYLAAAEQGKSNQYERVRLGFYNKKMNNATDAKEISRRVGGRLEEKAARWEGEYLRWLGAGDAYAQTGNAVKDQYKLAEFEWQLTKKQ